MSEKLYVPFGRGGPCPTAHAELAFEDVLARLMPQLWVLAKRLTTDRDLQDDLVQEGEIRLWQIDVTRFVLDEEREMRYVLRCVANHMRNVVHGERAKGRSGVCRNCLLRPCSPERRLMCSVSGAAGAQRRTARSQVEGATVAKVFGGFVEQ